MLITAEAIALRAIAHGDRSAVLKAWTRHAGARSYMVRVGPKATPAALQPLARIEVVADERADRDLFTARELRVRKPFLRIPFDPVRGAIALFAQELLLRVLRAESADEELHAAAEAAIESIDSDADVRFIPHRILLRLAVPLGFSPEPPQPGEDHFDLEEGRFTSTTARHGHLLAPPLSVALADLLNGRAATLPTAQRRELLDHLLLYYRLHLDGMGEMRSPGVLHTVLA